MANARPQLIVALDNCRLPEAEALVDELQASGVKWFKVGLELYTQSGPSFVAALKKRGLSVFLDLKLYDIPNTVAKAVAAAGDTGADLLTLHASGGPAMLESARQAAARSTLSLLAVTVLTSFSTDDVAAVSTAWGAPASAAPDRAAVALRLAEHVSRAGISGIVCSVSDLCHGGLRKLPWRTPPMFVTPGIRNVADAKNDQASVATVEQAVNAGATHLVVGRPITAPSAGSRADAARFFLDQIKKVYVI